ncbi:MAG: hypothetical protein ACE5FU_14125 [Nitrospinota bacterium]
MNTLRLFWGLLLSFALFSTSVASQMSPMKEVTLVVPEARVKKIIEQLLPYKIDLGEGFSGSFWLKNIDNLKIEKNKISFNSHIFGEDIYYLTKIGTKTVKIFLGNVNSMNKWKTSIRYEPGAGKLFVKPSVDAAPDKESLSRGDFLLDALLQTLSGIEYPVKVDAIKPFMVNTVLNSLLVDVKVSDFFMEDGTLFLEVVPSVSRKDLPKG